MAERPAERARLPRGDVAVLIGTRPEAIKLMPVVHAIEDAGVRPWVFLTGQHNERLHPWLGELGIQALLRRHPLRTLVVHGDTTSVAMACLVGFYEDIRVAHVEAGLRTGARRDLSRRR